MPSKCTRLQRDPGCMPPEDGTLLKVRLCTFCSQISNNLIFKRVLSECRYFTPRLKEFTIKYYIKTSWTVFMWCTNKLTNTHSSSVSLFYRLNLHCIFNFVSLNKIILYVVSKTSYVQIFIHSAPFKIDSPPNTRPTPKPTQQLKTRQFA